MLCLTHAPKMTRFLHGMALGLFLLSLRPVMALSLAQPTMHLGRECSNYFRKGRQLRGFDGYLDCKVRISSSASVRGQLFPSHLKITRRVQDSNRKTVKISRRSIALEASQSSLQPTLLVLRGLGGRARYRIELEYSPLSRISESCSSIEDELGGLLFSARSCSSNSDCGQILSGFGCGCSHDFIVRKDVDAKPIYALLALAHERQCTSLPDVSTCECRPVLGFACNQGLCEWDEQMTILN